MRRLLLAATLLLLLGCNPSVQKSRVIQAPRYVTNSNQTGTVPLSQLGSYPFCTTSDHFCADFPFVAGGDSIGSPDANFVSGALALHEAFTGRSGGYAPPNLYQYTSTVWWGGGAKKTFVCRQRFDARCNQYDIETGVHADTYAVVIGRSEPAALSLDQFMPQCFTTDTGQIDLHTSQIKFKGVAAVRTSCKDSSRPAGSMQSITFRHDHSIYELQYATVLDKPSSANRFFDSFHFNK